MDARVNRAVEIGGVVGVHGGGFAGSGGQRDGNDNWSL
jgi:hypothetical protein